MTQNTETTFNSCILAKRNVELFMIESWGRYPKVEHTAVHTPAWLSDVQIDATRSNLPLGLARSYGDSCLNENGALICTRHLNHFVEFNKERGTIRCEAGVTLADVLELVVPHGYFLPVTPGTKFVTIGGAIANDVHGKNHHAAGTFGCHVLQLEVLRSDNTRMLCSPTENADMFRATIGGLGLTGIILWAEFTLLKIPSAYILQENIRFNNVRDYLVHSRENDKRFTYVVSWIDCTSTGNHLGRGIFTGGNFTESDKPAVTTGAGIPFPMDAPSFVLNKLTIKTFNVLYYNKQYKEHSQAVVHYNPFFYPLDAIHNWNKGYGKNGFFQYQLVIPFEGASDALQEILKQTSRFGKASFVTVLKNFGAMRSPGMMSFPKEGVTLALDFRNDGTETLRFMDSLDSIVRTANGRLYPAKDARMKGEDFRAWYPQWQEFANYIDPHFSSSFWRRVMA